MFQYVPRTLLLLKYVPGRARHGLRAVLEHVLGKAQHGPRTLLTHMLGNGPVCCYVH